MSGAARTIAIRLSAENAETVRRPLEKLGADGKKALEQIDSASAKAQPAMRCLSAARAPFLDGATPEELAEFSHVAQIALPIAKDVLGISTSFAKLVADVARTFRTAAPGSDPANLGALLEAQGAGADRLELAVLSTGQTQTEVLRSLLSEQRGLTAALLLLWRATGCCLGTSLKQLLRVRNLRPRMRHSSRGVNDNTGFAGHIEGDQLGINTSACAA